jgi:hypothetical protein
MSAEVPYRVLVLRLIEDIVEVNALTESEALENASKIAGVARVLSVIAEMESEVK